MGNLSLFLLTYLLGGLTLLPLLFGLLLLHAHLAFPYRPYPCSSSIPRLQPLHDPNDDNKAAASRVAGEEKVIQRGHEPDVAEGYFAVCREYVPGGVNGKPPERTTPAGEVVGEESPSVYQSMYRSIFDRKQASTLETNKGNSKPARRARNVFYVVLRHRHLMLYDDSEQLEVRHVISLAHHDVSIYAGGSDIPEGELWIKRNAICLRRKEVARETNPPSKPFYFFSENCSDKEDFYFALLQNTGPTSDNSSGPPFPQHFALRDIVSLVQRLHSSEEHLQTRWLNAIIGRLFLAVYNTQDIEDYVRLKITKKIARVKRPAFLSGISLQKIEMGSAAPYITNPHLKDLTVDGHCCAEADFKYDGNFRLEIAATARIDLGTRFKVREVNLVLAAVVKKLEGHAFMRFKPPPSNRIWVSFETMPHLEMTIEPVVSSRQITYGIILRAIESRIREVMAETIVIPHWDDIPFLSTLGQPLRGGIWARDAIRLSSTSQQTSIPDEDPEDDIESRPDHSSSSSHLKIDVDDKSLSMPALLDTSPNSGKRKGHQSSHSTESTDSVSSFNVPRVPEAPKSMRTRSLASAAPCNPVVSMDNANVEAKAHEETTKVSIDATSIMTALSNRAQPMSPLENLASLNSGKPGLILHNNKSRSVSSASSKRNIGQDLNTFQETITGPSEPRYFTPTGDSGFSSVRSSAKKEAHRSQNDPRSIHSIEKRQPFPAIGAAAAAAKKWGWSTFSRNAEHEKDASTLSKAEHIGIPTHPIGRGRPLPPPGQPLPRPEKRSTASVVIPRRKPLPLPLLPDRRQDDTETKKELPPALPDRRKIVDSKLDSTSDERVLIVEAPYDYESASPLNEGFGDYLDNINPAEDDLERESSKTRHASGQRAISRSDSSESSHAHSSRHSASNHAEAIQYWTPSQEAQDEETRVDSISVNERRLS